VQKSQQTNQQTLTYRSHCHFIAGILTVGVVTYPFSFEGRRRCSQAVKAIEALRESVDSVVIIPNDKLLEVSGEGTALTDAFSLADDVLRQGVQVSHTRQQPSSHTTLGISPSHQTMHNKLATNGTCACCTA